MYILSTGLKINHLKTKFMCFEDVPKSHIEVERDIVEELKEYIYIGQMVNMCRHRKT